GLAKFPFKEFTLNEVWLEIVALAHDLIVWTQALVLDGELARAEPKRLRYRLMHVAGRLAFHGRRGRLRLQHDWPWATELAARSGLAKFPFKEFTLNEVWLEIVALAHDLIVWTQALVLDGELARAEPKRLRYRLMHVAGRLAFHGRRGRLRLQHDWPWATELAA